MENQNFNNKKQNLKSNSVNADQNALNKKAGIRENLKDVNFGKALIIATLGVLALAAINLIFYRPPAPSDQGASTQSKLSSILPRGSSGSILRVGGKTYLIVNNVTPEEIKNLQEQKLKELQGVLNTENLEIQPSGQTLRQWRADSAEDEETGPTDDHSGESGF